MGSTGATEAALCDVLAQTRSGGKKSKKHQEKKKIKIKIAVRIIQSLNETFGLILEDGRTGNAP